jgi:hypothetical protein
MTGGQMVFSSFILRSVETGKEKEANALLAECFGKQDDESFDEQYGKSFTSRLLALIQTEKSADAKNVIESFVQNFLF